MSYFDLIVIFCIGQHPVLSSSKTIAQEQRKVQARCMRDLDGCITVARGRSDIKEPWFYCTKDLY